MRLTLTLTLTLTLERAQRAPGTHLGLRGSINTSCCPLLVTAHRKFPLAPQHRYSVESESKPLRPLQMHEVFTLNSLRESDAT